MLQQSEFFKAVSFLAVCILGSHEGLAQTPCWGLAQNGYGMYLVKITSYSTIIKYTIDNSYEVIYIYIDRQVHGKMAVAFCSS